MSQTARIKRFVVEVLGLTEDDDPEGVEIFLSDELLLTYAESCAIFDLTQREFAKLVGDEPSRVANDLAWETHCD